MVSRIKEWFPPALIQHLKPLLRHGVYFAGRYPDWAAASASASGYDADLILERVKHATLALIAGRGAFERDSVLFDEVEHSFPVLAALLRAAVERDACLSVLDFGGSLGSSYFQCRHFLAVLRSLTWHVVEQPHFVRCGRECVESRQLKFHFSIDEVLSRHRPDVVLLSSVLQYLPDPYSVLSELMRADIDYIIIDRTPFCHGLHDSITVQHVPPAIYSASYPCWIFSDQAIMQHICSRYTVIAEFDGNDGGAVLGGMLFAFGGKILRRK